MYRFYESVIKPLIVKVAPTGILEIGSFKGDNTLKLLEYCRSHHATLISIDPDPQFDYESVEIEFDGVFKMICDLSLNALPEIGHADLVLIDGDHNWYTVYNELQLIDKNCSGKFPVVILHDVGWPYGRRDLYYNPENIPTGVRLPYAKNGIILDSKQLSEDGLNGHLNNAIYENNYHNGVLTAVEDFLEHTGKDLSFVKAEGLNGLGVIFPSDSDIGDFIDSEGLLESVMELTEHDRIRKEIRLHSLVKKNQHLLATIKELKENKTSDKGRMEELSKVAETAKEQEEELRREIGILKESEESLMEERDSLVEKAKEQENGLRTEIETLTQSEESLMQERDSLVEKAEELVKVKAEFERLEEKFESIKNEIQIVTRELQHTRKRLEHQNKEMRNKEVNLKNHKIYKEALEKEIAEMYGSMSWRVTRPIRKILGGRKNEN